MTKIVVSIPIHEESDVVINQVNNIIRYIPGVNIVLHIAKTFVDAPEVVEKLKDYKNVFVNPERLESGWGNIMWTHVSNFNYITQIVEFDYFVLHASNDMYVRAGIEAYISQYDAGFHIHHIYKKSRWWPGNCALEDNDLKKILTVIKSHEVIATQVEGSFYRKEVFSRIVKALTSTVENKHLPPDYTREEIYFSTVAYSFVDHERIGFPTTFSEVHRFDRKLWNVEFLTWGIYHRLKIYRFVDRDKYDHFEQHYIEKHFCKNRWTISVKDVEQIVRNNKSFIRRNMYLNDGVTRYKLYDYGIYSVKRVNRKMSDPVRIYINNL